MPRNLEEPRMIGFTLPDAPRALTARVEAPGLRRIVSYQPPGSESWTWHLLCFVSVYPEPGRAELTIVAPGFSPAALEARVLRSFGWERMPAHVRVRAGAVDVQVWCRALAEADLYLDGATAKEAHEARLAGLAVSPLADPRDLLASASPAAAADCLPIYLLDQARRRFGRLRYAAVGPAAERAVREIRSLEQAPEDHGAEAGPLDAVVLDSPEDAARREALLARVRPGGLALLRGTSLASDEWVIAEREGWTIAQRRDPTDRTEHWRRVLVLYRENDGTTAKYFVRALRSLGLSVQLAGPGQGAVGGIELPPDADLAELWERLPFLEPPQWVAYFDVNVEPQFRPRGLERLPVPSWAYFIDSHLHLEDHVGRAWAFDAVSVAHGQYVPFFAAAGHPRVSLLPCAADPEVFRPFAVPRTHEVAFVGNVSGAHGERRALLEQLAGRYGLLIQSAYFEQCAIAFNQASVVFNRSINGDLNMRVFEAMASGAVLLTDRLPAATGLEAFFRAGEELLVYEDAASMLEALRGALAAPERLERMRASARRAVLEGHTYRHRALEVLENLAALRPPVEALETRSRKLLLVAEPEAREAALETVRSYQARFSGADDVTLIVKAMGTSQEIGELTEGLLSLCSHAEAADVLLLAAPRRDPAIEDLLAAVEGLLEPAAAPWREMAAARSCRVGEWPAVQPEDPKA